jgi:hypothetical protein
MLEEAKITEQDLYLTFIDLTNAFGTVPADGITKALAMIGCPDHFLKIANDLYDNISMWFRLRAEDKAEGNPISLERGVRQGCPLSPIIFIIVFNPLLLWLEEAHLPRNSTRTLGFRPSDATPRTPHLAFCDDLLMTSQDLPSAAESARRLACFCELMGLDVNHGKCGTVVLKKGAHVNSRLLLAGKPLPSIHPLGDKQRYKYLGYWVSGTPDWQNTMDVASKETLRRTACIAGSGLLPLQKIQTMNSWASPVSLYCLPNMCPSEKWLSETTLSATRQARRFISHDDKPLLSGIPSQQFTSPRSEGGLGVHDMAHRFYRARILHSLTLLSSDGPTKFLSTA